MTSSTRSLRTDSGPVTTRAGAVTWSLRESHSDLTAHLPESVRGLLDKSLASGIVPVATTAAPFQVDTYFRPLGHVRAFYGEVSDGLAAPNAVVGFKGSEVWTHDLASVVQAMSEGRTSLNGNDFFVLLEAKAPVAYLLHEAMGDANSAADLYSAVTGVFGGHPRLPLPLCVVQWPAEAISKYEQDVMPYLSGSTRKEVERLVAGGLAEYIYYYPGRPDRLRQHAATNSGGSPDGKLIDRWVTLFSQILVAGYLPGTLSNQKWGCCVQDQNVCMDGGFVDIDSTERIDIDPDMLIPNLLASVQMLAHSIYIYTRALFPNDVMNRDLLLMGNVFGNRLHHIGIMPHVWNLVATKLREFASDGFAIHPIIQSVFVDENPINVIKHVANGMQVLSASDSIDQTLRNHVVQCSRPRNG